MLNDLCLYLSAHWLEVLGVILSIAGVWLTALEKVINWPIGIVASAMYVYIFYASGIYGDAWLSVFYVVIGFYGWYEWLYGGRNKEELPISVTSRKTFFVLGLIFIPSYIIVYIMLTHAGSTIPFLDTVTTVLSLIGTWMMARKLIENWLLWIFADLLYVIEYLVKGLYLTAVLYFIFTILAVYGYYEWKKHLKKLPA